MVFPTSTLNNMWILYSCLQECSYHEFVHFATLVLHVAFFTDYWSTVFISTFILNNGLIPECVNPGEYYLGHRAITDDGLPCLPWNKLANSTKYHPSQFPGKALDENYCRCDDSTEK